MHHVMLLLHCAISLPGVQSSTAHKALLRNGASSGMPAANGKGVRSAWWMGAFRT